MLLVGLHCPAWHQHNCQITHWGPRTFIPAFDFQSATFSPLYCTTGKSALWKKIILDSPIADVVPDASPLLCCVSPKWPMPHCSPGPSHGEQIHAGGHHALDSAHPARQDPATQTSQGMHNHLLCLLHWDIKCTATSQTYSLLCSCRDGPSPHGPRPRCHPRTLTKPRQSLPRTGAPQLRYLQVSAGTRWQYCSSVLPLPYHIISYSVPYSTSIQ